jgi:glycosyltransferase involved in cell wall biosynthesis
MILLCELSFFGRSHVPFNAGLLATIRAAFPKTDLSFFGDVGHIEELKKAVGQPLAGSIAWREILPPASGTVYVKRFFRELSVIRHLFMMLPQDSTSRLLLTSAYPSTVLALKVARCFHSKQTPVQIVLHGLSGVVGKRYKRPIRRFQDMKTALTLLGNKNIQYLVLEQSIRDMVLQNLPCLSSKIETFEHPISPNEGATQPIDLSEPIRFGFLGLADKPKGFPLFVKLADHVTARYERRAEFHAIGHLPGNGTLVNSTEALATKPGTTHMSRENFLGRLRPLHFVVLPHEAASYTLTASGVLLDAIAWGKPVIARRMPIFEAIFEKHGDIGYLFDEDKELKDIVEKIMRSADKSHYHRQVLNLRNARKSRDPDTLAVSYRAICRKCG